MSGKIIGLGGIFIKSGDKQRLSRWYQEIFDIKMEDWGTTFNIAQISDEEIQVFSVFPSDTNYIDSTQSYMINWMVDNLDALVIQLKEKKVEILGIENSEFGKFAWIRDIDGNKLELWEPPKSTKE